MTLTIQASRRLDEIGLLLAFVGAAAVALGGGIALSSLKGKSDRRRQERASYFAGGIALAVGFLIQILAVHR